MDVRLVALVPVLGLVLSGCSQDETPPPVAVPSSSAVASPSPTAAAVPSEAAGETPQAAAAFVRYYYTELGKAFVSLDSTTIRRLSAPECVKCKDFARSIDDERATGNRYSGGGISVRIAEASQTDARRTSVNVVYDNLPVFMETAAGSSSPIPVRSGIAVEVQLVRSGQSWLVSEILAA